MNNTELYLPEILVLAALLLPTFLVLAAALVSLI
jgi:hypothetical protein